jgi:hypothetical protein
VGVAPFNVTFPLTGTVSTSSVSPVAEPPAQSPLGLQLKPVGQPPGHGTPQTLSPPAPQTLGAEQPPQSTVTVCPQESTAVIEPQFFPRAAQSWPTGSQPSAVLPPFDEQPANPASKNKAAARADRNARNPSMVPL